MDAMACHPISAHRDGSKPLASKQLRFNVPGIGALHKPLAQRVNKTASWNLELAAGLPPPPLFLSPILVEALG